jgi:hypothetical protein
VSRVLVKQGGQVQGLSGKAAASAARTCPKQGGKAAAIAACIALAHACSHGGIADDTAAPIEPPKDALVKTTENGPAKVDVRVWPAKPTLDDPIYLRLDITSPAGVRVEAPFQEAGDERMGRFRVVGFTRDGQAGADGSQHQIQTYTLEAPSSGKHRVPPLRLEMIDPKSKQGNKPQEILTEEVPLDIAPVKEAATGAELKPAAGALDPDVGGTPWSLILLLASAGMVATAAGVLGYRAWRVRRRRALQRSAYDEAIGKLRVLESRGAPIADHADAWFVELSAIVRRYLERRYEIRAPELTTEEFLQEAARGARLSGDHRGLLTSFLERCDRVKFAGYRPEAHESIDSLAAARAFVEDTRLRAQEVAA